MSWAMQILFTTSGTKVTLHNHDSISTASTYRRSIEAKRECFLLTGKFHLDNPKTCFHCVLNRARIAASFDTMEVMGLTLVY